MRLVCPSCGAVASAEAWQNDTFCRNTFDALVKLPPPVLRQALAYLGLFRQGTKALPWRRAQAIIRNLNDLVETGNVHWQGGETRPCPPEIWGKAMEATLQSGPKGLKNNNYLRHVAWEMAAGVAAKAEVEREAARRGITRETDDQPEPMSEANQQALNSLKKKLGVSVS
ncbi:MAG: hypothetical protein HPY65_07885 [Syntrophaceae bacterium]|nr:hypothetical protein [Syntrophaceae bacterium]